MGRCDTPLEDDVVLVMGGYIIAGQPEVPRVGSVGSKSNSIWRELVLIPT